MNDPHITGIEINGHKHKISQYADDTALLAKCFADWKRMAAHLQTWCDATAMKENMSKREGMLLAKLNRERERAPKGIIPNDAWAVDGTSIRALGVPMGNKLNVAAWWETKYRTIKQRTSA